MSISDVRLAISTKAAIVWITISASSMVYAGQSVWTPNGEKNFTGFARERWTGKAIPGAWVAATWVLDPGGGHEQPHCSINEVVRADSEGRYVLPYYEGRPPQFIEAFAHRYLVSPPPQHATRDPKTLEWIVTFSKLENGKQIVASTKGPYKSEQEAVKASRTQQDVWLLPFEGTDEEWEKSISTAGTHARLGCASYISNGVTDWLKAVVEELEGMPASLGREKALSHAKGWLAIAGGAVK